MSSVKSHSSDGWAENRVSGGGERIILICILSIQTSGSYLSLFKGAQRSHRADTWEKGLAMHSRTPATEANVGIQILGTVDLFYA